MTNINILNRPVLPNVYGLRQVQIYYGLDKFIHMQRVLYCAKQIQDKINFRKNINLYSKC